MVGEPEKKPRIVQDACAHEHTPDEAARNDAGQTIFPAQLSDDGVQRAYKLDLKLGFRCNNRCTFCVQGDKRDYVEDLTTAQAIERLEAARATCDGLLLTGGEISIRDDVPEIIRAAKSLGYTLIQVQTNGRRLAYMSYCEALVEAGATEFNPSLHGHIAPLHDGLVGAKGAYNQVIQGLRNLQKLNQKVLSQTVITRMNVMHLRDIANLLVHLGVWQVQFAFVHALGTAAKTWDTTVPRYRDVQRHLPLALDLVRAAGRSTVTEAVPFCFLKGREWAAVEPGLPDTTVYDGDVRIGDYARYRLEQGKAHGPPCDVCTWQRACEGPWHEYPDRFGWDEFIARTDPPPSRMQDKP